MEYWVAGARFRFLDRVVRVTRVGFRFVQTLKMNRMALGEW